MPNGHTILAVPVPELDPYVSARTAHYDPSFLSADPAFVHAHVTVLGPWLPTPTERDLGVVGAIAAAMAPFAATFAEVGEFPDGLIHLPPAPAGPFRRLTALLAAAFPQTSPYEGRYADPVPHLTLDRRGEEVSAASVRRDLSGALPVTLRVDRLDLQWWANHDCRVLASWKLGDPA